MLFDNDKVESLYTRLLKGDTGAVSQIHHESTPLIEYLANKVCQSRFDDLVQEGHVKLYHILNLEKFNPSKNTRLYSFLYTALQHTMIDYLRSEKRRECESLEEWEEEHVQAVRSDMPDSNDVLAYMDLRFPTLPSNIKTDLSQYILENWLERQKPSNRAAIKTIEVYYLDNRRHAYMYYNAQLIYLRAKLTNVELREAQALKLASNGHEFSLVPEIFLVTEHAPTIHKLLKGLYIKF